MEPSVMPETGSLLAVLFLSGVVAYGVTEIVKLFMSRWRRGADEEDATWWQAFFRFVPLFVGSMVGFYFFTPEWGLSTGASGGVLSVALYRRSREFIKTIRYPSDQ